VLGPNDRAHERSAAFAREFEPHAAKLVAWARLRVRRELWAVLEPEDLAQEVGCRALARFAAFDSARATFAAWLFGIASHVLNEALRALGRGPGSAKKLNFEADMNEIVDAVTTITKRVARDESWNRFTARAATLDDDDRALLVHHGLEGLSHKEVATLMGISEDTARKRWQRLITKLREDPRLADLLPD